MIRAVKGSARFLYDFVVGDDWTLALGVVVALLITRLARSVTGAWIVLPIVVCLVVAVSLQRAARSKPPAPAEDA